MIDDATFSCPQCGASKDIFLEIRDEPITVEDPTDLNEIEAEHTPIYYFEDEELVVEVGELGVEHTQTLDHKIEWIELRDEYGDLLDCVYFGLDEPVVARFSVDEEEKFEVFACCSEHGIWKGISRESLGM